MAVISQIKATSDNVDYNIRDDYSIWGGRNLILGTSNFSNWYKPTNATISGNVITFPTVDTKSWVVIASPSIPIENYIGKDLTVSFDIRSDDWEALNAETYPHVQLMCKSSAGGPQATTYSTRTHSKSGFSGDVSDNWERKSFTFESIDLSNWTKHGDNEDVWLCINIWLYQLNSVQFRHFKVEQGTKATDWSPAPEDIARFIGDETIELYSE